MRIDLNKVLYPSQNCWSEYVFIGNECGKTTRMFRLLEWNLPIMYMHNGEIYRKLCIELHSLHENDVPSQKIDLVLNSENNWVVQGQSILNFKSKSLEFKVKLKLWDKTIRSYVNVPKQPRLDLGKTAEWSISFAMH